MKKNLILFVVSVFIVLILISCSDGLKKMFLYEDPVRIEYSRCTGCFDCLEDFQCPENAIKKDPLTSELTVYIDIEKCTQCMKCITIFHCPETAITTQQDMIAPGLIGEFMAISDTFGTLEIQFIAPGDDDTLGTAFRYDFTLRNQDDQLIETNFEVPRPETAGTIENWTIYELPVDETVIITLQAFDEVELASEPLSREIMIAGLDHIPPAMIIDLSSQSLETSIELYWTAPGDDGNEGTALRYEIRYNESEINEDNWIISGEIDNEIVPDTAGTLENITISNFPIQVSYYFAIRAFDEEDNSSPISNNTQACITGDITSPAAISDLNVADVAPNSMLLTWTAVGDNEMQGTASSYIIKISGENITEENWNEIPEYENTLIPLPAGSQENIILSGLQELTTYYAAIKVLDEVENISPISNVISETTTEIPDEIPPAAITDLQSESTETEIILVWTATGDDGTIGTAYQYEMKMNTELITDENWEQSTLLPDPPIPSPAGSAESYTVVGLEIETDYYFAIKVIDDAENISQLSNVVSATLLQDEIPPAPVTDLNVVNGYVTSNSIISINWTGTGDDEEEGIVSYYIIRRNNSPISEDNWEESELVGIITDPLPSGSTETFNVTGLNAGTVYYFALKAFDDNDNESEVSNSPGGKIVYQINVGPCNGCGNCVSPCPQNAITDHGSWASIDPDRCDACGTCVLYCPRNAIHLYVVDY